MSDNAKLKELAEALKRAIEQAEHKPGEWAGTAQSMGGICCPGVPFQIGKPWAKEEPWASFSYKRDSWLAVAAVNALPRLLGLIAENERLTANVKLNLCDHPAIHQGDVDLLVAFVTGTSQIELAKVHHCTPPNISRKIRRVRDRLGWREGMSVLEIRARAEQLRALASQGAVVTADLMAERDQLKAEIAGLKTGYEAYEQVNAELKAENERLERNRDMWKGQVERQTEELRLAHEADKLLKSECEGLRESLTHAADEVESWGAYASDYFQQKHDLAGTVLKVRQAAVSKESGQ